MKNIVIAAGYATRLGELTKNFPKPLLKIGNSTILGRMLDDIDKIDDVDEHIIITNHKFAGIFEDWKKNLHYSKPITIVDDGTETNETRLGAVCDLLQSVRIQNWGGTFIGMHCYLDDLCYDKIEIGKNVTISYGVYFACHGRKQGHNKIIIEDGAYIGMRANIIAPKDITIGSGAIVGAASLVNRSVVRGGIVAGIPAKPLHKKVNEVNNTNAHE